MSTWSVVVQEERGGRVEMPGVPIIPKERREHGWSGSMRSLDPGVGTEPGVGGLDRD